MGTPDFAVPSLKKLIETQEVVGVVTQPDRPAGRGRQLKPSPVKVAALSANIPIYQPPSLRKRTSAQPLHDWNPDLIIVAAFGQILRNHVLNLPRFGCLNVHASLLPRWRGASPIQHAILEGDAETGVSLMHMDRGLDTGAVYVMEKIPLAPNETAATLHDKLAELGADMVERHLDNILSGKLTATPQDDTLSTYAPMISKADGQLDWTESAVQLDRRIRAMSPWPGAYTSWQGKMLKVLQASPVEGVSGEPGRVISHNNQVVVATPAGGIALHRIQLAGKRSAEIDDFVRGRQNFIDSTLK